MTDTNTLAPCGECGMLCAPAEYHPYAACLMFKACHKSDTVRANLDAVRGATSPASQPVALPAGMPEPVARASKGPVAFFVKWTESGKSLSGAAIDLYTATQVQALLAAERGFAQEPFGYFKAEPLCWTNCAETEEGAFALYKAPQPQQIAEPAQVTLEMIADILGTGSEARKNHATLIRCIENAIRRSDCLSRIERGFFMVPTDDDEDEEPGEECLLNWGQSPDDYAKQFGEALDAIIAARGTVQGQTACDVPPPGWRCTRMHGHEGPCAAAESPEDKAFVERGMRRIRDAEDAQRYRLMKRGQHWSVIDGAGNTLRAEVLDAAVDAAITAQQGGAND